MFLTPTIDQTPVVVFASRFHRAARDGLRDVAGEASERDSNLRDEDGLTPTLWAAFCGHYDVLRIFISRGGDPSKSDRLGNTGLHLAAFGGHTHCVGFLISMGQNVWAMNVDSRTPRDLAAASPNGDISLRLLDSAMAKEMALDPKKVRTKKQRAQQRARKLNAEYRKNHEKEKIAGEEELLEIMERSVSVFNLDPENAPRRHSDASLASSTATGATSGSMFSVVRLQALQRGRRASANSRTSNISSSSNVSNASQGTQYRHFQFKVGTMSSDGSRVARPLPGIAPSTEVLFVNGINPSSRRHSLVSTGSSMPLESVTDAFELAQQTQQENVVVVSPPADSDSENEDPTEVYYKSRSRVSIFDRPGFGTMAFRHSLTGLELSSGTSPLDGIPQNPNWVFQKPDETKRSDENLDEVQEEGDDDDEEERSPLQAFLMAWGLPQLAPQLTRLFKGELQDLLHVAEDDMRLAGIPLGPRKKLLRAIEEHNSIIESPPSLEDAETKL